MGNKKLFIETIREIEEIDSASSRTLGEKRENLQRGAKRKRNLRMHDDVWSLLEEVATMRSTTPLRLAGLMVEVITKLWRLFPYDYELFLARVEKPSEAHAVVCVPENRTKEADLRLADPSEVHEHDLRTFAIGATRCLKRGVLVESLIADLEELDRMVRKELDV